MAISQQHYFRTRPQRSVPFTFLSNWFSKCSSWTASNTRELVKNADSSVLPQPYCIRILRGGAQESVLNKPSTRASLVAQRLKGLPAMWETWVRSLSWEDPLKKEKATHSSILAWRIPWTKDSGGLQSTGSQRIGHDWATNTFTFCSPSNQIWAWRNAATLWLFPVTALKPML